MVHIENNNMKCLIISGGNFENVKLKDKYNLIIACDKGYLYANKLNITPNIIIGDFDSAKKPNVDIKIIEVSSVKDDTDTGLAVKYALKNGYRDIDIICALGKRIDHTLANISLMKYIVEHNGKARILSKAAILFTSGVGLIKIKKNNCKFFSVFSLTDKSKIDYIKGSKFDVENLILKNSFPLGVSNEFNKQNISIKISSGVVLVILVNNE